MSVALEMVLARAGLRATAKEFLSLVEEAAEKLSPAHPEPSAYFLPEQQAALAEVGADLSPLQPDEADPRARAVAAQTVLRDSALSAAEVAGRLQVDASRIRHRIAAGRLIGWKDRGGWRLPVWQFSEHGVLPGLEVVLAATQRDQPPLVVAAFMNTPQHDLAIGEEPTTPRDWLLAGGAPERVAELASMLGIPA